MKKEEITIRKTSCIPAYENDKLYFVATIINNVTEEKTRELIEFDIETEKITRRFDYDEQDVSFSPVMIENGVVYFGSGECRIISFDIKTWKKNWERTSSYKDSSGKEKEGSSVSYGDVIVIEGEKLFMLTNSGEVCLNKNTGEFIYEPYQCVPSSAGIAYDKINKLVYWVSPVYDKNSNSIIEAREENIICYDLNKGEAKWKRAVEYSFFGTPALKNGVLYVSVGVNLIALDAENGKELGNYNELINTCSAATAGDTVYVDNGYNEVVGFKILK